MILLQGVTQTITDGRRKIRILDDVNLSVNKGEFLSIVGPSGSGKSTLLNVIGLLDRPTHGDYWLNKKPVIGLSSGQLANIRNQQIGFIFQSFMLLPRLTAFENVELPLLYTKYGRHERRERAMSALNSVGMSRKDHRKAWNLSGGEKQRVAIARALVNDPALIIADEPTGNLDEDSKAGILNIFAELKHQGRTVIMVTHDVEAARIADRCLQIHHGKVSTFDLATREVSATLEVVSQGGDLR